MKLNIFPIKHKVGLCLSGGGLRAMAHLGVIQAIEDLEISIHEVSGTSAGAIVGAFYCKGFKAKEMLEIVKTSKLFDVRDFTLFNHQGIISPKMLYDLFSKYLVEDSFESLKLPLHVAVTNINKGTAELYSQGTLFDKLQATAAVPFVFPTVEINGDLHCDGGVLNNLPIEPLENNNEHIIASHVNSIAPLDQNTKLSNTAYAERLFHLGLSNHVYAKKDKCDVFINPPNMTQYGIFNQKVVQQLFDIGYEYAMKALSEKKV